MHSWHKTVFIYSCVGHTYIHTCIYIYTYTSEFLHKTKPYPSKDIPAKDNTIPSKTGCHKTPASCNAPAPRRDLSPLSSFLVGRTPYIDICLHGTRRLSYIVVWSTQIHNCKTPWYILESAFWACSKDNATLTHLSHRPRCADKGLSCADFRTLVEPLEPKWLPR